MAHYVYFNGLLSLEGFCETRQKEVVKGPIFGGIGFRFNND